jgi:hypothetical protein
MLAKERIESIMMASSPRKNSAADVARVHAELRSVLTRKQGSGSGVDWGSIARVVVERYADRLEYLRLLLSSNATNVTFTDAAEQAPLYYRQQSVMEELRHADGL